MQSSDFRGRTIRRLVQFFGATALAMAANASWSQTYPSKEIRILVGFGPGGVSDIISRLVGDAAGKLLGQPMVVDNRPGLGGVVAATAVKNAAPDGYTFYGGSVNTFHPIFLVNGLDAAKELAPVAAFAFGDWFLYAPTNLNINSLRDLAAYAKANPGNMRFSAPSPSNTLLFHMVAKRLGFTFENIPYKTTAQTIQALLTGEGAATFNAASGFDAPIQAGKIKVIATLSPQRSPVKPDVPTAREQGLELVTQFNVGLWGPRGMPQDVVAKVNAAVREAIRQPAVAEKIRAAALTPTPTSPQDLMAALEKDIALYKEAIDEFGFQKQ